MSNDGNNLFSLLNAPPPYFHKGYRYFSLPRNYTIPAGSLILNDRHQPWILSELATLAYEEVKSIENVIGLLQKSASPIKLQLINFISVNDTQVCVFGVERSIVVSFRGTEPFNAGDWFDDSKALPLSTKNGRGGVHPGFQTSVNRVYNSLMTELNTNPNRFDSLLVAGHSLGGAVATLFAEQLAWDPLQTEIALKIKRVSTYGAPKVGNEKFGRSFQEKLHDILKRYKYGEDPIPTLPPPVDGITGNARSICALLQ